MVQGVVVNKNIPSSVSSVPAGCIVSWNIPVSDTTGVISDYFDLDTGLGLVGTSVEGWVICDGQNGTVDSSGRYGRSYGATGEILGDTLGELTALPLAGMATASTNWQPAGSVSVGSVYPISTNTGYRCSTNSRSWSYDKGSGASGSGFRYPKEDNYSSISSSKMSHKHTVTITNSSKQVGYQTITNGGDAETRPNSTVLLFITKL